MNDSLVKEWEGLARKWQDRKIVSVLIGVVIPECILLSKLIELKTRIACKLQFNKVDLKSRNKN